MDPDPMAQADVERLISQLMSAAGKVTVEVGERARAAAEADTTYRVAYAKAFLAAEGPVAVREATATVACEKELHDRKLADGLLLSAQEAGRNARARLEAARTLCANLRDSIAHATGYGG